MVKAKAIMTENVITIKENATIADAAKLIVNKHVRSLFVTKDNYPVAIVTQRDTIKALLNKNLNAVKVRSIMNKDFLTITQDTDYSFIVENLKGKKIDKFPVTENSKLVGIITETDIIDATRDFTRFHQIMQEVILAVFGLVTAFFLFFFSPLGQSLINAV